MVGPEQRALLVVFAVAALVLALLGPHFATRLDPLTGDEPFYVMTAISIVRDGDLDETNNYDNRDYDEFYPSDPLPPDWQGWPAFPRTLPPHAAQSNQPGLHTKHGIGLSALIAVPYALAGRAGAMAVMVLAGALLAVQMFLLAREAGGSLVVAAVTALALALTLPIVPYALLLFPEVPAALALIYAVRRLSMAHNEPWQWLLTGLAIGGLPWLHQRFVPSAGVLGVVLLWRFSRDRRLGLAIACLAVAVAACVLVAYNWWLYQSPVQNVDDHAGFASPGGALNGLAGLLLDAQWGLLIVAPVYLVALVAVPRWISTDRRRALLSVATILPYIGLVAAYQVWWGEWGPAARYIVPVVPLAAGAIGALVSTTGRGVSALLAVTWLVGAIMTTVGIVDPQRLYHHPDGVNKLVATLDSYVGTDLAGTLVAYQPFAVAPLADRVIAGLLFALGVWVIAAAIYVLPQRTGSSRGLMTADSAPGADTLPM